MLSLLAVLSLLCLVAAAIAAMFKPDAGKRLLVGVLALLLAGPPVLCLLNSMLDNVALAAGEVRAPSGGGTALLLLILVLVAVAAIRFVIHRRKIRKLLGEDSHVSLKRRLDTE